MSSEHASPLDRLWSEYSLVFKDFDDLTLARWMSQTLGQLKGRAWRLSHPLLGAYRLAAQIAYERQVWLKRLVAIPSDYHEAECCRAPLLPLLTRDVVSNGLVCQHCSESAIPFADLPVGLRTQLQEWADEYGPIHSVAHRDDDERRAAADDDRALEEAAKSAEKLLARVGQRLAPALLQHYTAVVWEDQDECLEVRPEDVEF